MKEAKAQKGHADGRAAKKRIDTLDRCELFEIDGKSNTDFSWENLVSPFNMTPVTFQKSSRLFVLHLRSSFHAFRVLDSGELVHLGWSTVPGDGWILHAEFETDADFRRGVCGHRNCATVCGTI